MPVIIAAGALQLAPAPFVLAHVGQQQRDSDPQDNQERDAAPRAPGVDPAAPGTRRFGARQRSTTLR